MPLSAQRPSCSSFNRFNSAGGIPSIVAVLPEGMQVDRFNRFNSAGGIPSSSTPVVDDEYNKGFNRFNSAGGIPSFVGHPATKGLLEVSIASTARGVFQVCNNCEVYHLCTMVSIASTARGVFQVSCHQHDGVSSASGFNRFNSAGGIPRVKLVLTSSRYSYVFQSLQQRGGYSKIPRRQMEFGVEWCFNRFNSAGGIPRRTPPPLPSVPTTQFQSLQQRGGYSKHRPYSRTRRGLMVSIASTARGVFQVGVTRES